MESNNVTFEQQVVELTNQERAKNGLSPLKANAELNYAADKYAQDMSEGGFFSHTGQDGSKAWDRAEAVGYEARMMGENIAAGQRTPEEVVQDWMNSPGHRANILQSKYADIGVGFYNNYWVQDFGSGDTNPISKIPDTSNSQIASKSTPTPASPSTRTATLDSVSSNPVLASAPASTFVAATPKSASDIDKETGSDELIGNQAHDWLVNGNMGNNTFSGAFGGDTLMVGQVENVDWIKNLQLSENKPVIDCSRIVETLTAPQIDNYTPNGDRNTGTLFAPIKEVNANALIAPAQNTYQ